MGKKIQLFPDLHGYSDWRSHLVDADLYIFLADYCDSYIETDADILKTVEQVIDFQRPCVRLLGNHDVQYIWKDDVPTCRGVRFHMTPELNRLFEENLHLFQFAYREGNYLFTHAGVTNKFYNNYLKAYNNYYNFDKRESNFHDPIDLMLNQGIHSSKLRSLICAVGPDRGGSEDNISGPLWNDLTTVEKDSLKGFHQVVGHTKVEEIYYKYWKDSNTSILCCDRKIEKKGKKYLTHLITI